MPIAFQPGESRVAPRRRRRWDQRQAERDATPNASFGSAITESETGKQEERKAERAARRRARRTGGATPAVSSFMAGEAAEQARDLNRRVKAGDLLSEDEFYAWAEGKGDRFNPNYENYLRFVGRRRGLGAEAGAEALGARAREEAAPDDTHARLTQAVDAWNRRALGGQATVGLDAELSPGVSSNPFPLLTAAASGVKDLVTEKIPGAIMDLLPDSAPGTSIRVGQNEYGLQAPEAPSNGLPASAIPMAGLESESAGLINELSQVPERLVSQPVEAALYTPAFLYQMATDPVGTAKQIPAAIAEDFRHPLENAGYLMMDLLGGRGALKGAGRRVQAARTAETTGDRARAFLRPVDRGSREVEPGIPVTDLPTTLPRGLTNRLPWNTTDRQVGRARARTREVDADFRAAEAGALRRDSRGLSDAEGIAVHAVAAQVEPMELAQMWADRRSKTKRKAVAENLDRAIQAASEIDQLGILTRNDTGRLVINPEYQRAEGLMARLGSRVSGRGRASLADIAERTRGVSRADEETKIGLGELDPETARRHIDDVGAFVRGVDLRSERKGLEKLEDVGRDVPGKTRAWIASLTQDYQAALAAGDEARASAIAKKLRQAKETGERIPDPVNVAMGRSRIEGQQQLVSEESKGDFYTYLGEEKPGFTSNFVPQLGGRTMGTPRTPVLSSKHAWTGGALANATFDFNAPRVTAKRALAMTRERARLDAYEAAKGEAISATDLIERISDMPEARRAMELRHWNAVRTKTGTKETVTNRLLDRLFADDSLFAKIDKNRLEKLAADADAAGQVEFFDNRRHKISAVRLPNEGAVRQSIDAVTQAAKFSLLFTKLTGYATPQLLGQAGMSLIGMGLHGSLEFGGKAAAWWRKLTPKERAVLDAGRGGGITQSMQFERGPLPALRKLNGTAANLYGVVIDSPFRTSSFLYHANSKGFRTLADVKRLLNAKEGTPEWQKLREIRDLVDEDFGRFSRLTGGERELARFIFFYPWLRASTLYALKLPRNHPVKTMLLVQGGRNAREDTQNGLAQLIERLADESPERAQQLAEEIMKMSPGLFLTGGTDAAGMPKVVSPQSAAVLQGPHDLKEAFSAIAGGEPERLLRMGTPGVSLAAAALNYDTFRGQSYPQGTSLDERVTEELSGYVPFITLKKRLGGDSGKTFSYTPEQAWKQTFQGSQSTKGLNVEGAVEVAERELPKRTPAETLVQDAKETRRVFTDALRFLPDEEFPEISKEIKQGRLPAELRDALSLDTARKTAIVRESEKIEDWDDLPAEDRALRRLKWTLDFFARRKLLPGKDAVSAYQAYQTGRTSSQIDGFVGSLVNRFGGGEVIRAYRDLLKANGVTIDLGSNEYTVTNKP